MGENEYSKNLCKKYSPPKMFRDINYAITHRNNMLSNNEPVSKTWHAVAQAVKIIYNGNQPTTVKTLWDRLTHVMFYGKYYNDIVFNSDFIPQNVKAYVYTYRINGDIKYVGKGSINKWFRNKEVYPHNTFRRATAIHSHSTKCIENHMHIDIYIEKLFNTEKDALKHETYMIKKMGLDSLWNKR